MDMDDILLSNLLQSVIVEDHLIRPCPTIITIVVVDLNKTVEQLLDVIDISVLDVTDNTQLLTLRQQQTAKICPTAFTDKTLRTPEEALLLCTLQHSTHIDAQSDIIVFQSFTKRRGIDDILMEVVG